MDKAWNPEIGSTKPTSFQPPQIFSFLRYSSKNFGPMHAQSVGAHLYQFIPLSRENHTSKISIFFTDICTDFLVTWVVDLKGFPWISRRISFYNDVESLPVKCCRVATTSRDKILLVILSFRHLPMLPNATTQRGHFEKSMTCIAWNTNEKLHFSLLELDLLIFLVVISIEVSRKFNLKHSIKLVSAEKQWNWRYGGQLMWLLFSYVIRESS